MNNEKETITITLPNHLADKLREIDRLVGNGDLGQTLAEACGWRIENLTESEPDEIYDFLEEKRWRSKSACVKAAALIAARFAGSNVEIERDTDGWRVRFFRSARWHPFGSTAKRKGWTTMRRWRGQPIPAGRSKDEIRHGNSKGLALHWCRHSRKKLRGLPILHVRTRRSQEHSAFGETLSH